MGWAVVVATTMVLGATAIGGMALAAVAPRVAAGLGLPASMIGYQVSVIYIGALASSLLGGSPVAKWGACRTSQAAMFVAAMGCVLMSVPSAAVILAGSALVGMGTGLTNPAASHLLVRFAGDRHRNLIFSIKQTGVPLGGVVAGLALPPMVLAFGWQAAPLTAGLIAIAIMAALQPLRSELDRDRDSSQPFEINLFTGITTIWKARTLKWLSLAGFAFAAVQISLTTFLVTMAVREVGLSLLEAGVLLALVQAAGAASRVVWGWVADRAGNGLGVLVLMGFLSAASALAVTQVSAAWPVSAVQVLFVFFGIMAIGWNGLIIAELSRQTSRQNVSTVTGGALAFIFAGVLTGPTLYTTLFQGLQSYAGTFGVFAAVTLAGVGCVLLARR